MTLTGFLIDTRVQRLRDGFGGFLGFSCSFLVHTSILESSWISGSKREEIVIVLFKHYDSVNIHFCRLHSLGGLGY